MSRTFPDAVLACSPLRAYLRGGLQALRRGDRDRLRARRNRGLTGSVDVDSALARRHPNSPRWDYGVGYRASRNTDDVVHWVEVHPATDRDVRIVERKVEWLQEWLAGNAAHLAAMTRRFVWVSSGRTRLSPTSPALKRLAQKGCLHVGKVYTVQ